MPTANQPPVYEDITTAPVIHFDGAAAFGVLAGSVQIELACRIVSPLTDGGLQSKFITCARLRCTAVGAESLRDIITKALNAIQQGHSGVAAASANLN
jgi:hypothetical protein